jgi:hypothetical protein
MINVEITMGVHTMKIPYGTKKFFIGVIESFGITQGHFKVHLGENIKGINERGIKLIRPLPEYCAIEVAAQPSVKEGRHKCLVYFPDMYKKDLAKFADILLKKVGQEDVIEEEIVETGQEDVSQQVPVVVSTDIAETILAKKKEHEMEQLLKTPEMQASIIAEIFEKKGTGWIERRELFKIVNDLKLEYAANKLIGRLFSFGYIERDTENPNKRSKLTPSACFLIKHVIPLPLEEAKSDIVIDLKVMSMFEALSEAAAMYAKLTEEHFASVNEIENLKQRAMELAKRIEKITSICMEQKQAIDLKIANKTREVADIQKKITPRLIEASRRYEILCSELPAE